MADRADILVVSRSVPPDVGGYQKQFSLVLDRIAGQFRIHAVGATRFDPTGPPGWEGARSVVLPAHRLPRPFGRMFDVAICAVAAAKGASLALRTGRCPTLLLLSPAMFGAGGLVRFWASKVGPTVARFPSPGDARRSSWLSAVTPCSLVTPGPAQITELAELGHAGNHIPNAVEHAEQSHYEPSVALVGRLARSKRVDLALRAWKAASAHAPDWSLEIVGSGTGGRDDAEPTLQQIIESEAIPRVVMHGELDRPWDRVGNASAFVVTSASEGSPNSLLEALSRGIPVLAPEGSMEKWFDPVPPHITFEDHGDLSESLASLMRNPESAQRVGERGRVFVRRYHDPDELADRWAGCLSTCSRTALRAGWSRTLLQVPDSSLVLDIGGAKFLNPRADVRCDIRMPTSDERDHVPTVVADAHALPFRTGAFGASIASHVLEHVDCPPRVLCEMRRVAPVTYAETPSQAFERILPETNHRWAVRATSGGLEFRSNRWAKSAGGPVRTRLRKLYYFRLDPATAPRNRVARVLAMAALAMRAGLNRAGMTTARSVIGPSEPATRSVGGEPR